MTTKGTDNRFRSLTVVGESGTPSTPDTGDFKLYVADDGTFYLMDDTGATVDLTAGGFSDPMTTRGDIIVRNASNVTARLAIGSAGKVLSSDGTDVSWQTPSTSPTFVGCKAYNSTTQSLSDNSSEVVTLDSEEFDTSGFHSTSSNTGRITIPSGKDGTYLLGWTIYFAVTDADGQRYVNLRKNGSTALRGGSFRAPGSGTERYVLTSVTIAQLVATDYVEIMAGQNSGAAMNIGHASAADVQTAFWCQWLGG